MAATLPVLLATTLALVWMLALLATQLRVVDAARETARAAAREDSTAAAVGAGRRVAPAGAEVEVTRSGGEVVAEVRARVRAPGGLLAFLPSPTLSSRAVARQETR